MKKTLNFLGIIALAVVIGFGAAGCNNGTGGSVPRSNPFTGTAWEGQDQDGDSIAITFTDTTWTAEMGSDIITGTYTYSGKTATLTVSGVPDLAGKKATATISGNSLNVNNTEFGGGEFTLTKKTGPGPETGPLTITGIPSGYNGKWVLGMGTIGDEEDGIQLLAAGEFNGTTLIGKGAQISGGSVTLNVFEVDTDTMAVSPFTGNGAASFDVYIINAETFDAGENGELGGILVGSGNVTVTFTNGKGSGAFSESQSEYTITINGMDSFNGEPAFICLHSDIRDIDWDMDSYYGKSGTVEDGSLTVTFRDWDGSGSYQIAVFFWEDQGASMTATYYYTQGAELDNDTPLPAHEFDPNSGIDFNFSDFRKDGGGPVGPGGDDPFTDITAFKTHLDSLPANTAENPHQLVLNINIDIETYRSLSDALSDNNTKYVSLDLSGSTFYLNTIPPGEFSDCTGLTSIIIPDSVTTIGNAAFRDCVSLTSVTIPDSVTTIGRNTFDGCIGLTSVTISNSVESIDDSTFLGCTGLTSVTIPDSVKTISQGAFRNCTGLTSIIIPDSVTSIDAGNSNGAFQGCDGLESITIPFVGATLNGTTNTYFGYIFGAYSSNTQTGSIPSSLKTVVITGGNSIANEAFRGCMGLTSVTIPDSVESIGDQAFWNCVSLTSIDIPAKVTTIGDQAFTGCYQLKSVTIGSSVESISYGAFDGCKGLTSVTIPDSVDSIGDYAFRDCYLTSITVLAITPPTLANVNAFINTANYPINNYPIYVPAGSVDDYKGADVWKDITDSATRIQAIE